MLLKTAEIFDKVCCTFSLKTNCSYRAANNGRSMDNVRSKLAIDRTNPWIAGHLVQSFIDSFREI